MSEQAKAEPKRRRSTQQAPEASAFSLYQKTLVGSALLVATLCIVSAITLSGQTIASTGSSKSEIVQALEFDHAWSKSSAMSALLLTATVQNTSPYPVKDIGIACDVYGRSQFRMGVIRATFETVLDSKKTLRVTRHNMGFISPNADRVECGIVKAKRAR